MVKKGLGERQIKDAQTSQQAILKVLSDGEWHRYQELREQTSLSTATLSKHLKKLEKGLVEKKLDLESGEYPYPVYYRIRAIEFTPEAEKYRALQLLGYKLSAKIHIKKGKVVDCIRYLHAGMTLELVTNLEAYFHHNLSEEWIEQATEYFLITPYREAINTLKENLKELSVKEDVQKLLREAKWQLTEEFVRAHTKECTPEQRKILSELLEEFKTKRQHLVEGVEP